MTNLSTELAGLVEELARAIDEACVAYQQAFKDEFSPSRWDVPSADMARAILPIIHRHRIEARRKALEDAAEMAEQYRDGASDWHLNTEANPTGAGYCCLKTAANILGGIWVLAASKEPKP